MNIAIKLTRYFPSFLKILLYKFSGAKIGRNVVICLGSIIVAEQIEIADNVRIGRNCKIKSRKIRIGKNTTIGSFSNIRVAENLDLGANSNYGLRLVAYCRELKVGDFMHAGADIDFGYGSQSPDSKINIGKHCFLGHRTIINSEKPVKIGDDVGIGAETMIWTHGVWLGVLNGFPANFAPVKIGNRVWIPARTVILPGVEIGDDVVISINSVLTRPIPSGALVAGNPARIVAEKKYPKAYSLEKKTSIVMDILQDYIPILLDKGFIITEDAPPDETHSVFHKKFKEFSILFFTVLNKAVFEYLKKIEKRALILFFDSELDYKHHLISKTTYFDLSLLKIIGFEDRVSEDLRDYLRRKGIKIFTENRFCSIRPIPLRYLE